jgi:hypothetical protein
MALSGCTVRSLASSAVCGIMQAMSAGMNRLGRECAQPWRWNPCDEVPPAAPRRSGFVRPAPPSFLFPTPCIYGGRDLTCETAQTNSVQYG